VWGATATVVAVRTGETYRPPRFVTHSNAPPISRQLSRPGVHTEPYLSSQQPGCSGKGSVLVYSMNVLCMKLGS
jgi:hypothetical protein